LESRTSCRDVKNPSFFCDILFCRQKKDRLFGSKNKIITLFGITYPLAIILYDTTFVKNKTPHSCVLRYDTVSIGKDVPTFRILIINQLDAQNLVL